MLRESITRNSWLLAMFAVATTLLIAGTYLLTKERIAEQKRMAEEKALLEIVPRERHDNSMLDDIIPVGPESRGLNLTENKRIYRARRGDVVIAAIIPVRAPDGYTGDIDLIVGVNADGSVAMKAAFITGAGTWAFAGDGLCMTMTLTVYGKWISGAADQREMDKLGAAK